MRDYLKRVIARLTARESELQAAIRAAQTADEVRSLGETLENIRRELNEAKDQLDALEEEEQDDSPEEDAGGEERNEQFSAMERRGMTPVFRQPAPEARDLGPTGTLEYRRAFMAFVQRGTPIPEDLTARIHAEQRAGGDTGTTVAADIGAIIPETIMSEFIKDVSKVYGNIYAKVRKLNVRGGVKFPISKLNATFKWITETTTSGKQKAGDIKTFVTFEYNIGEIRVAETLLAQVVSLDLFESEITRIMVEAYVEAMDKGIISGTGSGQLLGITKDPRVTNVITMTAEEFSDWTAWRKKLFAKIPLSKRGRGEFLFPASTVESYLLTMQDDNKRPLFMEATGLNMGNTAGSFFGRSVDLVEPDVIADFDTAAAGDVVGIHWVPTDYAINTNLQFGLKRWFDDDTNEWINKGLTIVDGKILDPSGCYLIKKAASTPGG